MADHTDNALRASIKALDEVVLPAIDASDPLATEQLRLVTGFLKFLRTRLPHLHGRHRFELDHYLGLARTLSGDARVASPELADRIETAAAAADSLLNRSDASLAEMQAVTTDLSAAISALLRVVAGAEPAIRQRVERAVLAASKPLLDLQRSWFMPQGFDLEPGSVPALADAVRTATRT